jgi:6-phospho-beta-glucosidase
MKAAVIGGGGFRTPTLHGCLLRVADRVGIAEVVLHDLSAERLTRIRAVIAGIDRDRGGATVPLRTTTSLEDAVDGAGAVLVAIRVGGGEARTVDEEVPLSIGILGQETVGPGGIAFALRTIPVMRAIADVVRDRAPAAWFVNFTNPAGVVTQAVRDVLHDRAVGVCDSPAALCARVAAALGRSPHELAFDYAGLNHLGWLLAAWTADGEDVLPGLLADDHRMTRIDEARLLGPDRLRALGAIPNEYLVYLERAEEITLKFRRDGPRGAIVQAQQRAFFRDAPPEDPVAALAAWRRARDARHGTYLAEGWAAAAWDPPTTIDAASVVDPGPGEAGPGEDGYAAVAADFLAATAGEGTTRLILDARSDGRLDGVGNDEVAEVTCEVSRDGVRPVSGRPLPDEAAALVGRIREVERLTLRAATEGSRGLALDAIAAHPVVPTREVAERILDGYLRRHATLAEALR